MKDGVVSEPCWTHPSWENREDLLVSCPRNSRYIAGSQSAELQGCPEVDWLKAPCFG